MKNCSRHADLFVSFQEPLQMRYPTFKCENFNSAWVALCWCESGLFSQTAGAGLGWVVASQVSSGSLVVSPGVQSWFLSFLLFVVSPSINVTHHLYADDTQLYLALDSRNFISVFLGSLSVLLAFRGGWMVSD